MAMCQPHYLVIGGDSVVSLASHGLLWPRGHTLYQLWTRHAARS